MSESTISILIAVTILAVLALFVPCIDSLAGLLRRATLRREAALSKSQPERPYKREAA